MSDNEKQDLSTRIATLAEAADLPPSLLWEPAKTCPQGHRNYHAVYIHGGASTHWEQNAPWQPGDLCLTCLIEEMPGLRMLDLEDAYQVAASMAEVHRDNPDYHPEWRIDRVAKDLTDLASLLAVVEAWRQQKPWRSWSMDSQVDYATQPMPTLPYAVIGNERNEDFKTEGDTPGEALARAFAAVLEQEKGDSVENEPNPSQV